MSDPKPVGEQKVVFGELIAEDCQLRADLYRDSFYREVTLINTSGRPLWIVTRDGLVNLLPPHPRAPVRGDLVVVVNSRNILGETYVEAHFESTELNAIGQQLIKQQRKEKSYQVSYSLDELLRARNGVYLHEADVSLFIDGDTAKRQMHLHCQQRVHNQAIDAFPDFNSDSMVGVVVRIVDNEGRIGKRYTVFHNRVNQLIPIRQPEIKSGMYVTGLTEMVTQNDRTLRKDEYFSWEDVEAGKAPFQLYESIDLANTAKESRIVSIKEMELREQQTKREHDLELAKLRREMELQKSGFEEQKLQYEKQRMDMDRSLKDYEAEMLRVKHLREMEENYYKRESNTQKHYQESSSNNQKMMVETVKTVGLIITSAFALWKIFG